MIDYFIVEQNDLNNNWTVYSKHPQLPQCYVFKRKHDANKHCGVMNERANKEVDDGHYQD